MSDQPANRGAYFDALYDGNLDPWQYHSCAYEIDKRADTLALLPRGHYRRAVEIGCSIGVLTAELARRCNTLIGIDIAEAAATQARRATVAFTNVEIMVMHVPHELPTGKFDLLMLSEVLYFLNVQELAALAAFAGRQVEPGGDVIIVSYDGETLTELNGRASTDAFSTAAAPWFNIIGEENRHLYHVRRLRRRDD